MNTPAFNATTYDYSHNGGYADTVATLADGRKLWINTQHSEVLAKHTEGCSKAHCSESVPNVCAETARRRDAICTCGALDGVIAADVLAHAKTHGLFGSRPVIRAQAEPDLTKHGAGWCDKCGSYCYGDCEA